MKKIFLLVTGSVLIWSCNNPSNETEKIDDHSQHETTMTDHDQDEHHYNESAESIELNDGERWVVNEEMKPYVAKTEELLKEYNSETDSHVELSERLTEQNNELIRSCTMTGKSHDELHKWLHPHMETVQALGEAESQEEAEKIHADLKQSIDTYHTYFQ